MLNNKDIIFFVVLALVTYLIINIIIAISAAGAELTIVGNAIGSGSHNITIIGDWINMSDNMTSWQISTGGYN